MNGFIGLTNLKGQFQRFTRAQLQNDRKKRLGKNVVEDTPLHLLFASNPGTGKTTCDEFLDKTACYKYLRVIINETLSWGDHVDYISTKVNQRLDILRRIRHLLPIHTRELYVKSMILPLLDYSDIVWGDKHNKTLMAKVQLLQGKAAKLILDKAKHSSATKAINKLDWLVLSERR